MKTGLKIVLFMMVFCGLCRSEETTISTTSSGENTKLSIDTKPADIVNVMRKVADWQLAHPSQRRTSDWTYGALFTGLTAWAQMADNDTYYRALIRFGNKNGWKIHHNTYHADNQAVGQMYVDLYRVYKDPKMIQGLQKCFDDILANPSSSSLNFHKRNKKKPRYWWCDALFMGPPTLAKLARVTGDSRYLDFMSSEWWICTDYLYDAAEHLYYRDSRYFDKREANGKKIFWSRGNGWVFGGLVRILEEMPEDYPDRPKFEALYRQMATKIKAIQPQEDLWHSSLLDPVNFPSIEASGSGFYCYGLAWGINHGYLDAKEYLPAVMKAWAGLVNCVHTDGKLGYVQPIGADPRRVTSEQTENYGVGSFLLAGSEVYKIAVRKGAEVKEVVVTNPIRSFRDSETVSLDWNEAKKSVSGLTKDNTAVFDFKSNRLLVTQMIENDGKTELLFQTDLAPGEKKYFWVMKQPAGMAKPTSKPVTFCRFVPERKDDFTWENDVIAFRMYGPALRDDAGNSGIDCWLKRVPYPIIDKWYGQMKQKTYHTDWGEGYDPYHVGNTAGCGGLRIVADGELACSSVYDMWKVIENGPIRSVFELTYDKSWAASGKNMVETKRVTIDLGQRLCRFDCAFTGDAAPAIDKFAVGLTTHDGKAQSFSDIAKGIAYCWEKIDDSHLGTAILVASPAVRDSETIASQKKDESHIYLYANKTNQPAITYYVGYGWEKAGQITTIESWQGYLENFKERIDNPVNIQFVD